MFVIDRLELIPDELVNSIKHLARGRTPPVLLECLENGTVVSLLWSEFSRVGPCGSPPRSAFAIAGVFTFSPERERLFVSGCFEFLGEFHPVAAQFLNIVEVDLYRFDEF